jgi:hypothetical protein
VILWTKFLVRAVAAFLLGGVGAMTLLSSTWADGGGWMLALIGGVMIVAGWLSWPKWPNAWRRDPPTDKQIAYALNLGIAIPQGASKGQLSDMISHAKAR